MKKSNENRLLDQYSELAQQTSGLPMLNVRSGVTDPVIEESAEGASVTSVSFEQTIRESCLKLSKVIDECREATIGGVGALPEEAQRALTEAFNEAHSKTNEVIDKEIGIVAKKGDQAIRRECDLLNRMHCKSIDELEATMYENKKKAEGYDDIIAFVTEEEQVDNVVKLFEKIDDERACWDRKAREWEKERAQWHRIENEMQLRENETPLSRWHAINNEIQQLHRRLDDMSASQINIDNRNCSDMEGRWMNRLPALSKFSGEKEEWDDFENGFMIRYGKLDTPVAMSLLKDHVEGKAKDALRGIPESDKSAGIKAVMNWLRMKLSNETPFDAYECELKLQRLTVGSSTVGEVTEILEKYTFKLYGENVVAMEHIRKTRLMTLYMDNEVIHDKLLSMFSVGDSYEAMKRALIEMEFSSRNANESRRWHNANGHREVNSSQNCYSDTGADHGHQDEYSDDSNEERQPDEDRDYEDRCDVCNGIGHQEWNCPTKRHNNWRFASMECNQCHGIGRSEHSGRRE